jgi:hypothetical protein
MSAGNVLLVAFLQDRDVRPITLLRYDFANGWMRRRVTGKGRAGALDD